MWWPAFYKTNQKGFWRRIKKTGAKHKIISPNLEINVQQVKSFKNEVNELKKSVKFTQIDLGEQVNDW